MTNTPTQTAARRTVGRYGSTMTADPPTIDPELLAALTASCKALHDAEQAEHAARAARDRAVVRVADAGLSEPAIARTITAAGYPISSSGVRYIVRGAR